ncbi:MAG: 4Fe-4S dicluster domain-containing protein, partial [Planctomycetota bacterium]
RSRCVNCQQCFQFCLFGVFEVDEDGAVLPVRPDNCKDGCPACGRVCPRGAIMFPLYTRDLAIAGAPGTRAKPDEAAKQMFEQRTNRPHADPNDDLDDLIDDLEQLMESD